MSIEAPPKIRLMSHQRKGVEIARQHPRFCFFHEPGCGKSIMMLSVHIDRPMPTVIVSPKAIMKAAWQSDAEKMGLPITVMHGTPKQRSALLNKVMAEFDAEVVSAMLPSVEDVPLLVTNFETFRKKDVRDQLIGMGVRRLIVDESSKIKNADSQISKAIHAFADQMDEVYLLSGTPAPNGPEEYWSQLRAIDPRPGGVADVPFGKYPPNFWRWAQYWMVPQKRIINGKERIVGWKMKSDRADAFKKMLATVSWALKMEDCIDIKPATSHKVSVELSVDERKMYDNILENLVADFDGERVTVQAQGQLMKLRQITGGHFYSETGTRRIGSTKIDALAELLDAIGNEPVVIWAEFSAEIDAIAELCRKVNRSVRVLDGRGKDNGGEAAAFQRGNDVNTLVCHPASVGHGVTLTRARYAIYYSCGFSYEQHEQSRRRIYRNGQKRKCVFYYITAEGTVDQMVLKVLRRKATESEGVLSVLRELAQGSA